MGRLVAIGVIWVGCTVAWVVLGTTILERTGSATSQLHGEVSQLWGPPQTQIPPQGAWQKEEVTKTTEQVYDDKGRLVTRTVQNVNRIPQPIALTSSDIDVSLDLEHRRKGLIWYPTYRVDFDGTYSFRLDGNQAREVTFEFPLQSGATIYDGFAIVDAEGKAVDNEIFGDAARWTRAMKPGESVAYRVRYGSRGISTWAYGRPEQGLGRGNRVTKFALRMTSSHAHIDFPPGTLSPSSQTSTISGWHGEWTFDSLISGAYIGLQLPQKLNPGPIASRITFFAPVSLLFFFFVVALLAAARGQEIHPLNYFLLGAAFFAFHLLFAYLVDHVRILPAFVAASLVSIALVISYARWFVGWKFALREMGISQLIYLVLFSATFFLKGFTGLSIVIGAILTLFVVMQITGKVDWKELKTRGMARMPKPSAQGAID